MIGPGLAAFVLFIVLGITLSPWWYIGCALILLINFIPDDGRRF